VRRQEGEKSRNREIEKVIKQNETKTIPQISQIPQIPQISQIPQIPQIPILQILPPIHNFPISQFSTILNK
jgi:hypothetical protein